MVNYPCIAVGINRYQFLQPLNYGRADASALRQFLVEEAGLPSHHCLLLTDTSPWIEDKSTYPTRENMRRWLNLDGENFQPDLSYSNAQSWRWFFFSGWGVSWQGVDYLMPIDGKSYDIPGTGISVRSLFSSLKAQGGNHILVLLDINRSPGLEHGELAGTETIELAQNMGITLVLSAQLDQFSHEGAGLGNGLFTTALLESLRYYRNDLTLADLDEYLRDRTPELNQHHWRPIQIPLTVIPKDQTTNQLILPTAANLTLQEKAAAILAATGIPATPISNHNFPGTSLNQQLSNGNGHSTNGVPVSQPKPEQNTSLAPTTSTPPHSPLSSAIVRISHPEDRKNSHQTHWWQLLFRWGGGLTLIFAIIFAAFAIRNPSGWNIQQALNIGEWGIGNGEQGSREQGVGNNAVKSPITNNQQPVTSNQQPVTSNQQPTTPKSTKEEANQIALAQAKGLIQQNQASLFNKAIAQARKIKPGDPLYQQAQEDISRWSQVILDLAEGRAKQGNLESAIVAAKLVTPDNPSIYAKAQKSIVQWQVGLKQQAQNQTIIQESQQQLVRNQASSYHRGIINLRKILPGQPKYGEAQKLINEWSNQIYTIANYRASQNQFSAAIQAAKLVPEGTPDYQLAQNAIARWEEERSRE